MYIDYREPFTKKVQFENLGFQVVIQPLDVGDYYFKCEYGEIIVERKTMADYDGSMVNGHLFDTAARMVDWMVAEDVDRRCYIKAIGNTSEYNKYANVSWKGRVGSMNSIMMRYGIPVSTYSSGGINFELLIDELAKKFLSREEISKLVYAFAYDMPQDEAGFNWAVRKLFTSMSEGKAGQYRPVDLFKYRNPTATDEGDSRNHYVNCFAQIPGMSITKATKVVDSLNIISMEELYISLNFEALKTVDGIGDTLARRILTQWNVIL